MKLRKLFIACAVAALGAAAALAAENEGLLDLMRERCSVRDFQQKVVEEDVLNKILEAGRIAPTNHNRQPVKVFAVRTPELTAQLHKLEKDCYNAPVILVAGYDAGKCKRPPKEGEIATDIAVSMMMIQAQSLGVGSLWTRPHHQDEVRAICKIPENVTMTTILLLGYPAEGYKPRADHFQRKPMEEFAEYR